jgi:hypothetical protein
MAARRRIPRALAVLALGSVGFPLIGATVRGTPAGATATRAGFTRAAGATAPAARVSFVVNTKSVTGAISPLIYGLNADDTPGSDFSSIVAETRPGLIRLGGNRWTAYNWESNASNAGSDYNYENDDYLTPSKKPGAAVEPTVQAAKAAGAAALVTIPIVGYVAGDESGGDVFNYPNFLKTKFKMNRPTDPAKLTTTPVLSDDFVYQNQFVYWLKKAVPGADVLFSLDNEPDLWDSTHREVHPKPVTYAELLSRDLEYAKAIKKVWPTALVTGPVSYGWEGYETLQNAPDSAKDGNFLAWYLRQVKAADTKAGMRLVNDLDLHWYPEATGGGVRIVGTETTPAVIAAREQAPRSLWDPSYVEDSWITADTLNGKGIDLIPRIKGQIAKDDPGTALDFSEWNYGGGQSISGGIATADVLGIFGRYGVHAAALWPLNTDNSFAYGAFAVYRNYNGHGAAFGDTELKATTSAPAETSVYGSIERAHPGHVVIVVINKHLQADPATLRILGGPKFTRAAVYTLTSAGSTPRPAAGLRASGVDSFSYTMPAQSVSVIVPAVVVAPATRNGDSTGSHSPRRSAPRVPAPGQGFRRAARADR